MRKLFFKLTIILFFVIACLPATSQALPEDKVSQSIVKIYTISNKPDYFKPWTMLGSKSSNGSGCFINGNRILTNAHVVSNSTFIQVRKYGQSKKVKARVLSISHESDLALLTVDDKDFFNDVKPLNLGNLPSVREKVTVYGFPLGGDTLSVTEGIVSRIEHRNYAHSSSYLLAGQVDAAINPGNSGGPVMVGSDIVGVVMQSRGSADNIGYMVPTSVVKHYLKDVEDNTYNGFPQLGIFWQTMENEDLKTASGLPLDRTGILINKIIPRSPVFDKLQQGDILTKINDIAIADDGTIELRKNERTSFAHLVQEKQVGEKLKINYIRKGTESSIEVPLSLRFRDSWLVPMEQFEELPSYYIYGGLVFTKLTKNLLKRWGSDWYRNAPKSFTHKLNPNARSEKDEEVVVLLNVLASDITEGYHNYSYWVIDSVDDKSVLNFNDFVNKVKDHSGKYITFKSESRKEIVLNAEKASKQNAEIIKTYRISKASSDNF